MKSLKYHLNKSEEADRIILSGREKSFAAHLSHEYCLSLNLRLSLILAEKLMLEWLGDLSKTTQDGVEWKLSLGHACSRAKLPTTQPSRDGKALLFPNWAAFVGGPGLVTCISEPLFPCCPMSLNPKVLKMSSSSKTLIY